MMAEVALKRKAKGIKLNYPEAVAIISAAALDGARAGKTIEEVTKEARSVLTKDDVMDGVADLIPDGAGRGGVHRRQPPRHRAHADPVTAATGDVAMASSVKSFRASPPTSIRRRPSAGGRVRVPQGSRCRSTKNCR